MDSFGAGAPARLCRVARLLAIAGAWCLGGSAVARSQSETGRPMTLADLISIREYGAKVPSPNGQLVAIEVERPHDSRDEDFLGAYGLKSRMDLWIVRVSDGQRRLLVRPGETHGSAWSPVWSPDGNQLAFLATEGRDNAYVHLWDSRTGRIRRLATAGVDLHAQVSSGEPNGASPMAWLDPTHLLVVYLADGQRSLAFDEYLRTAKTILSGAAITRHGSDVTAVVASSPVDSAVVPPMPRAELRIIDVRAGSARRVGFVPALATRLATRFVILSRNHHWAAIATDVRPTQADGGDVLMLNALRLGVASLAENSPGIRWSPDVIPLALPGDAGVPGLAWSASDTAIALVAQHPARGPDSVAVTPLAVSVAVPSLAARAIATLDAGRLGPAADRYGVRGITWTADGHIAVAARDSDRTLWWHELRDTASQDRRWRDSASRQSSGARAEQHLVFHVGVDGTLTATDATGVEHVVFPALNPHLTEIAPPRFTTLTYVGAGGDTSHARVLLPYGYVAGTRYPTVFSMGGLQASPDDASSLNMLPLAGRGYAVVGSLWPGSDSQGVRTRDSNVLAAVDQAVAVGIADSTRLLLFGQSGGGYVVYRMLVATHRFKAAVANNGYGDVISGYLDFDDRYRLTEPNYAAKIGAWYYERYEETPMYVAPWTDPERYVRNSPVFYADRVTTPVLILDGEAGKVGTGDEEMFTALNRLGKTAEYVNYLGDDHVIASPADILDMWNRIFAWYDRYAPSSVSGARGSQTTPSRGR